MQEISINFDKDGNAQSFIGDGWSIQEATHIWTVGKASTLKISQLPRTHDLKFVMAIEGCRFPPDKPAQNLEIFVKNVPIKTLEVGSGTKVDYRISKDFIGRDGKIELTFLHPGYLRPLDFGLSDSRPLAICFYSISITQANAEERQPKGITSTGKKQLKNQNKNATRLR
jgi:hypothetical protein